jgi:glycine cleavage system H protein
MAEVKGCQLPEDVYYWPEKHVWARLEPDGTVKVGMTDIAQFLAKSIVSVTPRGAGKKLKRGKSVGTVESGKWVGPVNTPVSGAVLEVNDEVLANPKLINSDPYGEGWVVRIQPDDWEGEKTSLVIGEEGIEAYRQFLDAEGISCIE